MLYMIPEKKKEKVGKRGRQRDPNHGFLVKGVGPDWNRLSGGTKFGKGLRGCWGGVGQKTPASRFVLLPKGRERGGLFGPSSQPKEEGEKKDSGVMKNCGGKQVRKGERTVNCLVSRGVWKLPSDRNVPVP